MGEILRSIYFLRSAASSSASSASRCLRQPIFDFGIERLGNIVSSMRRRHSLRTRLSATMDTNRAEYEARFWELYWGELPFVESVPVREKMATFCNMVFGEASARAVADATRSRHEVNTYATSMACNTTSRYDVRRRPVGGP
jgi:hypothetical protein